MAKKFSFGTTDESGGTGTDDIDFSAIAIDPVGLGSGDDTGDGATIGDLDGRGTDSGDSKPRRGRKPRDPNAPKPERKPRGKRSNEDRAASVEVLKQILAVANTGVSVLLQAPEFGEISDAENTMVAKSADTVMQEFNIAPDPKIAAVIGLVMAVGGVYGPRVLQVRMRNKRENKEAPKNKLGLHAVGE